MITPYRLSLLNLEDKVFLRCDCATQTFGFYLEVLDAVTFAQGDLKHLHGRHVGRQTGQALLPTATNSDQQSVTSRSLEDATNSTTCNKGKGLGIFFLFWKKSKSQPIFFGFVLSTLTHAALHLQTAPDSWLRSAHCNSQGHR